jgi:hypothetical protein
MIIPLTDGVAGDPQALPGWLGVVVHEFGHQFLAYVSDARRDALSNRIAARGGLLQRRHANVVDEATQAALGNLLFMRERLPQFFEEGNVYSFEPDLDYPDLIDSLARAVEPLVKDALAKGQTFDAAFVDRVLAAQAAIAPPKLAHFSHVALLFAGSKQGRRDFDGLFWGRSRFNPREAAEFVASSTAAPELSRWVVATSATLAANAAALEASLPALALAEKDLAGGAWAGCVRAAPRPSGAWDVVVLAKDDAGLRRALIAVQRGLAPGDARPFCVK